MYTIDNQQPMFLRINISILRGKKKVQRLDVEETIIHQ